MRPKSGNGGFPGRLVFPSRSCGNDFRQLRGNQRFRYFHLSTTSIPYGDQLAPGNGRLAQAVGAQDDRGDVVRPSVRSKIAPWKSLTDRNHPSPEWPTFRPEHRSGCCCPTRSSGCWPSIDFTLRRNTTKVTARISHQPIWPGEISRG